jgi:hypothetical protein
MTQVSQGSLTIVNPHTREPSVFWNGALVPGVKAIGVDWDNDESRVKLRVSVADPVHAEMRAAGINVKVETQS